MAVGANDGMLVMTFERCDDDGCCCFNLFGWSGERHEIDEVTQDNLYGG